MSTLASVTRLCYDRRVTHTAEKAARAAVHAFTPRGALLGARIALALGGELHLPRRLAEATDGLDVPCVPFDSLSGLMGEIFQARTAHVFVAAAGVAVRAVAPHLRGKAEDPAVLVLDQEGAFCISLLSGHLGGANALARRVAAAVGAQPVITTATDAAGLPALDELGPRLGLRIANLGAAKGVSALLLAGERPQLYDPEGILAQGGLDTTLFRSVAAPGDWDPERPGAWAHWSAAPANGLGLHPPCLHAGMGCRRGTSEAEILDLLREGFGAAGLAPEALAGLASIDAKADEPGLLQAAATLGAPVIFFTKDQLAEVETPSASPLVRKHMGVDCVCEAAALLAAKRMAKPGSAARLLLPKMRNPRATLAVAASSWSGSARAGRNT